jgi:hypothetical protein
MAIARVDQGAGVYWKPATNTAAASVTCTYGTSLTSGSLLVAVIGVSGSTAFDETSGASVSNNGTSQTWTIIPAASIADAALGRGIAIAYFKNNQATGTPTVTASVSGSLNWALWIAEFTGCDATSPHEGSDEMVSLPYGTGTTVMTGRTIAVASTALMVSATMYYPNNASNMVAGTGYTKQYDSVPASLSTYPYAIQDRLDGTGTQSVAWGAATENKTDYIAVAAAFKIAGASTTRGMPFGNRSTAFNGGRIFTGPIN